MGNPVHVALLAGLILLWVIPAVLTGRLAEHKGRSFGVYLVAALLVGWPVPLVVALLMPNRTGRLV